MFARRLAVVMCIVALAQVALAQDTKPAASPAAPIVKAQPILEAIPAGSMGYVVVPSVKGTFASVNKMLQEIGVADMLAAMGVGDLLDTMKSESKLGAGFNAEGGFAAVMLDPQAFGIDLVKAMDNKDGNAPELPFVLFVPGSSVKDVFSEYEMAAEGAYTKVQLRMGPMLAGQLGGYVILSPMAKALDAVVKAEKKAAAEVSKDRADVLAKTDVGMQINMKVAGPLYLAVMNKAVAMQQPDMPKEMSTLMTSILPMYGRIITQIDSLTITLNFARSGGIVFDEYVTVVPDSPLGKVMASFKSSGQGLVDRLPNLPYVLALGSEGTAKDPNGVQMEMLDALVKALPNLSDASRANIKKICAGFDDQVTGGQLVIGGAPEGSGVMGLAWVIACKDSDAVKQLLSDSSETILAVIKEVAKDNKADVTIAYKKDADKLEAMSVDTITLGSAKMEKMEADDKAEMKALLGQDSLVFYVTAPDKNTVVVTFGGDKKMLQEAVKTAKTGGTIAKDAQVAEVLKALPKPLHGMALLNVGNLWQLIGKGAAAVNKADQVPPISLEAKTPLAMGVGFSGSTAQITFFLPNSLLKEGLEIFKQFMMMGGAGPRGGNAPPAGGGDF